MSMTKTYQGIRPLYGEQFQNDLLRAGVPQWEINKVHEKLVAGEPEIYEKFKDAIYEDPRWKAQLRTLKANTPEYKQALQTIARKVLVKASYVERSAGHGVIEIRVGATTFPIFVTQF